MMSTDKRKNTNAQTDHSKKLRQATAAKFNREKLASGEYKSMGMTARAEDIAVIQAAINQAGGSRVQALKKICTEWLEMQSALNGKNTA